MALYGFSYSRSALKALGTLPTKHRKQIRNKIEKLADDPIPKGAKLLQGLSDHSEQIYRIRSGDYRVLYCVRDGPLVAVLDIGHRKDIYRGL